MGKVFELMTFKHLQKIAGELADAPNEPESDSEPEFEKGNGFAFLAVALVLFGIVTGFVLSQRSSS